MKKISILYFALLIFYSSLEAQTVNSPIKLEFFKSIPEEIDGCTGMFTYESTALSKEQYIFLTNGDNLGMIQVNGKPVSLKMISTKELTKTSWRQVFKGAGYIVTLTTRQTKRLGEEDILEAGTLEIVKAGSKISIKIHGESGC